MQYLPSSVNDTIRANPDSPTILMYVSEDLNTWHYIMTRYDEASGEYTVYNDSGFEKSEKTDIDSWMRSKGHTILSAITVDGGN